MPVSPSSASLPVSSNAAAVPDTSMGAPMDAASEARWSAWVARGAEDALRTRRNLRIAVPVIAAIAVAVVYQLSRS